MRSLLLLLIAVEIASSQASPAADPYLLRLDHADSETHACALLQNTGVFHLEIDAGDRVKVFEGAIEKDELQEIEHVLNNEVLANLSQQQIEEPLIRTRRDVLQITVFRRDHRQELLFQTSDSQQPFEASLHPLLHWLDKLDKSPHRELSEDDGKNNCLPPKVIALKKRDTPAATNSPGLRTKTGARPAGPASRPQPPPTTRPEPAPALLRVHSLETKSESAHESCVLIAPNGKYRFEDRTQEAGKRVNTQVTAGQIPPAELEQLRHLVDDPALAKIKHHEPPGGLVVAMLGDMLDISISRSSGVQRFILSSRFNRPGLASFYSGDGDRSNATPLLEFLSEHVESNKAGALDPASRNGCTEAP